jgi:hypothetical protein
MPWLAAAMPYISAAGAAFGALSESQNQQTQLTLEANADKNNALALDQQAAATLQQAGVEEERVRKEGRQAAGEQRAAMAEAGTGLLSSTNQRLVVASDINAEQDALNVRYGGLLEAHGLTAKANEARFQAKAAKSQIKGVRASGYLNAFGSALSAYTGSGGRFGGATTGGSVKTGLTNKGSG